MQKDKWKILQLAEETNYLSGKWGGRASSKHFA